jgi:hypothetical protein
MSPNPDELEEHSKPSKVGRQHKNKSASGGDINDEELYRNRGVWGNMK